MAWDWQMFCEDTLDRSPVPGCFGKNGDITYLDWMLSAWGWTVSVSVLALLLALASGMIIGVLRTLPNNKWAVRFGNAWVEFFRNIPLLVQIFLWYHVIPAIFPALKSVSGFVLVVLALGFFTSARIAEQLHLSAKTVLNYLSAIRQKLEVHNDIGLMQLALRHGLVAAPGA